MTESLRRGILRLKSLREQAEAVQERMDYESLRFQSLSKAEPTAAVSAFNLFETPVEIADMLARRLRQALGSLDGKRVLEPSAGLGRLYRAVRSLSDCHVTLVELAQPCASQLYQTTSGDSAARLIQDDFLRCDVHRLGTFDAVIMNPPFKMGRDVKHIRHALSLLNPGGVLVSLCYAGMRQREAFGDRWELLPANSFKTEGTRAEVALVEIRLGE